MNTIIQKILPIADFFLMPVVYPAAWLLKYVRKVGVHRLPLCRKVLLSVGVFPIRNHYYEPRFDYRSSDQKLSEDRQLPGIEWNLSGQLEMLDKLAFAEEVLHFQKNRQDRQDSGQYYLNNNTFKSGDAEYWYQIIRAVKPQRIIEIGSGYSTLLAIDAVNKNREEGQGYECEHVCIEPYEMPWLEESGVSVVRKKVEELNLSFFQKLQENDILFIDSSHIIRPQGDVVFEYLQILPSLASGVIVHVHDIFTPKNYPEQWLKKEIWLWNEQYLLEAFLSHNGNWKIIGALNYLHHNYYDRIKLAAPFLTPDREPGSFYIQKS